ncbi:MAG TPA: AGE family epimerase/isomerase [Phycisphaerae bacterium]|nr:AGE family epimerase/isomerase [Phycisphaerae bacterium]HOJ75161.1 AGE family epimerase/isomerase [Phycisphaerae bacterium]HOQ88221.1 AGE family epimerase/isomerase [Phycisphaerae bacterium]HPZ98329.1 AGE family epimerase/isomerase [Phycisphaerae bacterium]HQE29917.1 AGE family epimerase/isomerase [Phycisphaerae bacterium]
MELKRLRDLYARTLLDDIVPWWQRHALDPAGGINSCIGDDGVVVSRDRWGWSQWRAVYVFSKLYNTIERRPGWLDAARRIFTFVNAHGPLDNGHWPMLMDADGQVKRGYESIFNDGFVISGLVELWKATHDDALLDTAMRTFHAVQAALAGRELPPMYPYPEPPARDAQAHGLSMLFSDVFHNLAAVTGDRDIEREATRHHRRVMDLFLRPHGYVVEWLQADGSEFPPPRGTAVIPGHAIESMWFQMHIARDRGDTETLDRACEVIRRHLEIGWDREFGGLFYAVDAQRRPEVGWPFADTKLWWPHTECLYATLLAHEHSRQPWCLDWHERIRAWSYAHFPVPEHGEWYQKLDRQGRPFTQTVALPVKDPFHLPRALILCIECLDRLNAAS